MPKALNEIVEIALLRGAQGYRDGIAIDMHRCQNKNKTCSTGKLSMESRDNMLLITA